MYWSAPTRLQYREGSCKGGKFGFSVNRCWGGVALAHAYTREDLKDILSLGKMITMVRAGDRNTKKIMEGT